jgi:N,N'-diacetyllegionaminate synthase
MYVGNVHIIAEAGTNHNGNPKLAKILIDTAVKARADSVKFQIINPEHLYLPGKYKFGHYDITEVIAIRQKTRLADEVYRDLAEYAKNQGIAFSASVFDPEGLNLLASMNPPYIKIASTDLNNILFLRKVAEKGIKMIISTGMSPLSEVEHSVNELVRTGFRDIVLMHCVSAYPANLASMNLGFIDTLKTIFGFPVGLSDHTQGSIAACISLTKGVSFIEKHFTLNKNQEGFDHKYATEPDELIQFIEDLHNSYLALSKPEKKIGKDEDYVKERARRSIYAARHIRKGETITEEDILIVRPSNILSAEQVDNVLGKKARTDIPVYAPLSFELLEKVT